MLYISERIANISELERQIQNAKLHFDILKEELKHTAPSATIVVRNNLFDITIQVIHLLFVLLRSVLFFVNNL